MLVRWFLAALALALAGCREPPPPASGLTTHRALPAGAALVVGTREVAVTTAAGDWLELTASGIVARPAIASELAAARTAVGGALVEVWLGARPIVSGGEDHAERALRVAPTQPVAVDGALLEVAVAGDGEIWRTEHALRSELTTVAADGATTALPGFPRVGPDAEARSPVSARACAAPRVRALAGDGSPAGVVALVTECHPDAAVRLARLPAGEVLVLPGVGALGFEPTRLAVGPRGALAVVGHRRDALAVARPGAAVEVAPAPGIESVLDAAFADDGALWTRWLARGSDGRDRHVVMREGREVALAGPRGEAVRAIGLAVDREAGIVVLAEIAGAGWLLSER